MPTKDNPKSAGVKGICLTKDKLMSNGSNKDEDNYLRLNNNLSRTVVYRSKRRWAKANGSRSGKIQTGDGVQ